MLSLSNGSDSRYEYTEDSTLEVDINFMDRVGLVGPPPSKGKGRLTNYQDLVNN